MHQGTRLRTSDVVVLAKRGWLARVPPEFRQAVLSVARRRALEPGEAVYRPGGDEAAIYGIVDGAVEFISRYAPVHGTPTHIGHPGFWFGFGPLVTRSPRRVAGFALTPTVLMEVPARPLGRHLESRPQWWRYMAEGFGDYADLAAAAVADFQIPDIDRRCIAVLLRLADCRFEGGGETAREIPMTQDQLAAMSNVSRNRMGSLLRRLEARGLVRLGYRTLQPTQPDVLRAMVEREARPRR